MGRHKKRIVFQIEKIKKFKTIYTAKYCDSYDICDICYKINRNTYGLSCNHILCKKCLVKRFDGVYCCDNKLITYCNTCKIFDNHIHFDE